MRRNIGGNLNIGASSLLLFFIVLSLVSFAVLSLSSAINGRQIVKEALTRSRSYYTACNEAQHWLEEMNAQLSDEPPEEAADELTYTVAISDTQELHVAIVPCEPDADGYYYTIKEWRVVNTASYEIDNHLNLLIP